MGRALFLLFVAPLAALAPAQAQDGGIQISPVMVAMSTERSITSLRVRNGRDQPIAFEIDAFDWRQSEGGDQLTPTRDLIIAPAVFEIGAHGEQIVRLGLISQQSTDMERAFRIVLRELPNHNREARNLGFTLEMSLPVFVTPLGARFSIEARREQYADGAYIRLINTGAAHAQLSRVVLEDGAALDGAPRYLLAGAEILLPLPASVTTMRMVASDPSGVSSNVEFHVAAPTRFANRR